MYNSSLLKSANYLFIISIALYENENEVQGGAKGGWGYMKHRVYSYIITY